VLQPHGDRTLQRMREHPGTVVVAGDITELDFTSRKSLRGQLGRIGDGRGYGYECFNLLAIRADTTEALDALRCQGKHDVIRSHSNRRIQLGHEGPGPLAKLHDHLRALPAAGHREIRVPAQDGQPARQAVCGVAWAAVRMLPPRQARGEHGREPLPVGALRVWELQPPAGTKPVEWLLLTNVAVAAEADAQQRLDWYELRWQVEELHKLVVEHILVRMHRFQTLIQLAFPAHPRQQVHRSVPRSA
jgi:hypothetical protein